MKRPHLNFYALTFFCFVFLANCSDELALKQNESSVSSSSISSQSSSSGLLSLDSMGIISFNFEDIGVTGMITPKTHWEEGMIRLVVPDSTSLTSLTPSIVVTEGVTSTYPATNVPANFSDTDTKLYQASGPAPFYKKNYGVSVTFENDFSTGFPIAYSGSNWSNFTTTPSVFVKGRFGLPATDFAVRMVNQETGESFMASSIIVKDYRLTIYNSPSLPQGIYRFVISRKSVEKEMQQLMKWKGAGGWEKTF